MSHIEPGETFKVGYGNGKQITVKALDLRSKVKVVKLMQLSITGSKAEQLDAFDHLMQALQLCCPEITEEQWATIDEKSAGEIIGACVSAAALSEDEEKKSE